MKRRRLIQIAAAAGLIAASPARAFRLDPVEWRGSAMGAAASLTIHHEDRAQAMALLGACRDEVERLERIFSLYRPDSALVRLNRDGVLPAPPLDLLELLGQAGRFWLRSDGAFDPTVQPLWEAYARHFAAPGADPVGPSPDAIEGRPIGWHHVVLNEDRVALKPGMALTLNGIAQGYITDRVADLLRRSGMRHVLVNMGEIAVIGRRGDGDDWQALLPDGSVARLRDGALAVSDPDGTRFSPHCHHIFDPLSGRSAKATGLVVVQAATATEADAMSTAMAARARFSATTGRRGGHRQTTGR